MSDSFMYRVDLWDSAMQSHQSLIKISSQFKLGSVRTQQNSDLDFWTHHDSEEKKPVMSFNPPFNLKT